MGPRILESLEGKPYLILSSQELETLLAETEILSEVDTHMNKKIRLFRYGDRLFLQEYSFDGEIFVRPMESREKADTFIQKRLDTYERMWDGCGCKINFHE